MNPDVYLIDDPRDGAPACRVIASIETSIKRRSYPAFAENVSAAKITMPSLSPNVLRESFILELGAGWTINGHQSLSHISGATILDRVHHGPRNRIFATDPQSSVAIDPDTEQLRVRDTTKKRQTLPEKTGLAIAVEPSNWGSFLTRVLPKAIELRELGAEYLLVFARHPRQLEMLELAGWKEDQIIQFKPEGWTYDISKALLPSEPTTNLFVHPSGIARLRTLLGRPLNAGPRKVFVSRRKGIAAARSRRCLNDEEVARTLEKFGYTEVFADILNAQEQIALFQGAESIIGPSGAGMFNACFSHAGTNIIDIESENHWIFGHCNLFSSFESHFGILGAQPDWTQGVRHLPYTVDTNLLSSILGDWG